MMSEIFAGKVFGLKNNDINTNQNRIVSYKQKKLQTNNFLNRKISRDRIIRKKLSNKGKI